MFKIDFLIEALNTNPHGKVNLIVNKFVVNSKKISPGDCFIGLRGEKSHGSRFFREALERGANGLIIEFDFMDKVIALLNRYSFWVFFVKDCQKALFDLAYLWRKKHSDIPIIAITGSAGKTTTKEMIKNLFLNLHINILATENSENGSIGLPLTLLNLREFHEVAIIEVGIQKKGEIDILIYLLQSIHTLILTVFMLSHGEFFHTIENVIYDKMKLQSIVTNKVIMPSEARPYYYVNIPSIIVDMAEDSDYQYHFLQNNQDNIVIFDRRKNKKYSMKALLHDGIRSCLVNSFVFALEYGLPAEKSIIVLENFKQFNGRFSIHNLKSGGVLINDAYNAASLSVMEKAIDAFISLPFNKKKILVLGDMFEQGESAERNHKEIYDKINNLIDEYEFVYFIGSYFGCCKNMNKNKKVKFSSSIYDIENEINNFLISSKYCVFFKSSNSMSLFRYAVDYLRENEC